MKTRDCCNVITEMLLKIPESEVAFIKDLEWSFEDARFKAPEETLQWERITETVNRHISNPVSNWQWEVLSIFTTKSIEELKAI